jgi:hypothetical protein
LRASLNTLGLLRYSTHHIQGHYNSTIGQLVADAKKELPEEQCRDIHLEPAIVGVFRKPHGLKSYRSIAQQDLEFNRLCFTYIQYCQNLLLQRRNPFTGTFLPNTFNPEDDRKMKLVVCNMLCRLGTQIESAAAPTSVPVGIDRSRKIIFVGIHVSQLGVENSGEEVDNNAAAGAHREWTSRWFIVSVTADWSGSDGFYRLEPSCRGAAGHSSNSPIRIQVPLQWNR